QRPPAGVVAQRGGEDPAGRLGRGVAQYPAGTDQQPDVAQVPIAAVAAQRQGGGQRGDPLVGVPLGTIRRDEAGLRGPVRRGPGQRVVRRQPRRLHHAGGGPAHAEVTFDGTAAPQGAGAGRRGGVRGQDRVHVGRRTAG